MGSLFDLRFVKPLSQISHFLSFLIQVAIFGEKQQTILLQQTVTTYLGLLITGSVNCRLYLLVLLELVTDGNNYPSTLQLLQLVIAIFFFFRK